MVARPPVDSSRPPERPYTVGLDACTTYDRKDEKNLLKGYLTLVSLYSQGQLGRPADGMNAVAGVFNVLAKSHSQFFSHLHHGLPDICFDFALLWSTHFGWQRPKSWDGQQKLPSWTWTGWFGGNDGHVEWNESLHWSGRPSVWSAVAWHVVDEHGHSQRIARVMNQITHQHDSDASKSQTPCGLTDGTELDMPPKIRQMTQTHPALKLRYKRRSPPVLPLGSAVTSRSRRQSPGSQLRKLARIQSPPQKPKLINMPFGAPSIPSSSSGKGAKSSGKTKRETAAKGVEKNVEKKATKETR
ncbi:hypothetical protein LTR10_010700 [Elasticomyces elasticus]|nr:hypothetical protein LTR10_010700 [Elasticomyces elasticus]KAK4968306.1 hypothetical protein LTR42_009589 [Elasticomyces elasticus]